MVEFSTGRRTMKRAIIAIVVLLVAGLLTGCNRAKNQKDEVPGKRLAVNLKNCDALLSWAANPPVASHGTFDSEGFGHWMYQHSLPGVYKTDDGAFYDGMSDEDYAACRAKLEPEIRRAGGSVPDCSKTEAILVTPAGLVCEAY
jgi:hypothetical protein